MMVWLWCNENGRKGSGFSVLREMDLNGGKYSERVRAPNEGFVLRYWREGENGSTLCFI